MAKVTDINVAAVGAAAAQVVAANTKRTYLILQNTSANPVRIGFTNAVTAATGFRLAQGERFVLEGSKDAPVPTDAVFAIREGGVDGVLGGFEIQKS